MRSESVAKKKQNVEEAKLASHWDMKFKEAMVAKAPYTKRWNMYIEAYNGSYNKHTSVPEYKSDFNANYIFSIIETIRPIMLDNDPKFQAMPRQKEGMAYSTDINETLSYEWDRETMSTKLFRELINGLTIGNYIFFVPWDSKEKNVKSIPVSPFNLFPDPLATSVDDAEYLIYPKYINAMTLKRMYPERADEISGGAVDYSELVNDNGRESNVDNQVLVLEAYSRDHETFEENSETGERKAKYPNGRVTVLAPKLGLVFSDKPLPYNDGVFPFVHGKDYDVPGKFWGEGEVAQLLSPQKYMNELNNSILDNAKSTANMPWIVDKNAGIPKGGITSRPGLIIRKNQGSEVRRAEAPNMPAYVVNAVDTIKNDMEQVSGIFDSLKGNSETGVYTAQGILALQEAGQARIRLKVKLMEETLGRLGKMWFSRMNQFWKDEKWIRTTRLDGTYDFKKMKADALKQQYDIKIMAGSTMPVNRGAMLDFMIRLAQTQMGDGQPLVDREAVAEYLPMEVKSALLSRSQGRGMALEQQIQQMAQQMQEMGQQLTQQVQEVQQQMQQVVEETKANDEQTMEIVEELTSAVETVNKEIVQVQAENDKLKQEKLEEEKTKQIESDSYNSGYNDAEKLSSGESGITEDLGEESDMGLELPPDILEGIENMTDDELALLIASNPEIADLLE